jgi:hypothetical protein
MSWRIPSPFRLVHGLILRDFMVKIWGFSSKKLDAKDVDIRFDPTVGLYNTSTHFPQILH